MVSSLDILSKEKRTSLIFEVLAKALFFSVTKCLLVCLYHSQMNYIINNYGAIFHGHILKIMLLATCYKKMLLATDFIRLYDIYKYIHMYNCARTDSTITSQNGIMQRFLVSYNNETITKSKVCIY